MNQINIQHYKTKIGELILGTFDNKLCMLDFRYRRMRATVDNRNEQPCSKLQGIRAHLNSLSC